MKNYYLGIDLGTTNSACALFDGTDLHVVRNARGGHLTPSVIRIDAKGQQSVGDKARRYSDRDPANTRAEFKRLMGTEQQLDFPASAQQKTPVELSAAIITSLCTDVEQQFGFRPSQALVTVPALFDLPQSNATAEAAKMAGLDKVELLQEPVASALAAGWNEASLKERWLVFDLGGGTFDASLLEYRDNRLRVVAHGGDNFLGGRDFDKVLTDWAIERIHEASGLRLHRDNIAHGEALRKLAVAVEEAKIDLSSQQETSIVLLADLEIDGQSIEVDLPIDRDTLDNLCQPLVERALALCLELLRENGVRQGALDQVVLVGGPSMMPLIRKQVAEQLAPVASGSLDPMTLVAQGAALYAAATGLVANRSDAIEEPETRAGNQFLLRHPSMSADIQPVVMGLLVEKADPAPASIQLINRDNDWASARIPLQEDVFMLDVPLKAASCNTFSLQAFDRSGKPIPAQPQEISIVHGLSISDPPLSRSIGVALANGQVRRFFDRGTPLPVKRTFTVHSVETVLPGNDDSAVIIPIVQGELHEARHCRSIGQLKIDAKLIDKPLLAGTAIEVGLELDRGGNLKAQAFVPAIEKVFTGVLHLLVPSADLQVLRRALASLQQRLQQLQKQGFQRNMPRRVSRYAVWQNELEETGRDLELLQGADQDAGLRASHNLTGLEVRIEQEEADRQLEEMVKDDELNILYDCDWIRDYGTEQEHAMLTRALESLQRAAEQKNLVDYARQKEIINKLGITAFERSPDAWQRYFDYAAARIHEASDLKEADRLLQQGRQARAADDHFKLKEIVHSIWRLLPPDMKVRLTSHDSGIR